MLQWQQLWWMEFTRNARLLISFECIWTFAMGTCINANWSVIQIMLLRFIFQCFRIQFSTRQNQDEFTCTLLNDIVLCLDSTEMVQPKSIGSAGKQLKLDRLPCIRLLFNCLIGSSFIYFCYPLFSTHKKYIGKYEIANLHIVSFCSNTNIIYNHLN